MDVSLEDLEGIGEAIQLASQADSAAIKEDDTLNKLEDHFRHLQLQQRLLLEADLQRRKLAHLKEQESVAKPQELIEKIVQASLKNDESVQIHMVSQKAIDVCQYGLALQAVEKLEDYPNHKTAARNEEEIGRLANEYLDVCLTNLDQLQQLGNLEKEIHAIQNNLKDVKAEIAKLKANPEADSGAGSERIQKLESQLDKFSGRFSFTRYLTQLLLMASEEDLYSNKIADLFLQCGEAVD